MKFLQTYVHFVDCFNEKVGQGVRWLTTILVVVVCYDVCTRYLLKSSSVAIQELEWHLFAIIFLMGSAFTLKHDRHVRVDVIYAKFSPLQKAWVNFTGSLLFLIPFAMLSIWASISFVSNSFSVQEVSPDPGGLPARYILKAVIPISFFLILMQAFSLMFKSLITILDQNIGKGSAKELKTSKNTDSKENN